MKLEQRKEVLWVHNLWLIEEMDKAKPEEARVQSLRKVNLALTAHEPSDEQRQILQRLEVEQ